MKKFALIVSAACALMAISSCEKECKKNEAPVVTVTAPLESAQFSDSVQIAGSVSDDVWLNDMAVMIHATNGDTVFVTRPDVYGKRSHDFAYTYYITTPGNLHLQVVATDNEGVTTEKEVMFTVTP